MLAATFDEDGGVVIGEDRMGGFVLIGGVAGLARGAVKQSMTQFQPDR